MNVEYYAVPPVGYEDPAGMNFKEFIRWKMKAVPGSDGRKTVTAAELADALGVNIKVLLDILNGRRAGPDRRDFVIALCAQLGLDADDTNDALGLFPGTLRLLSADDGRDREIMRVLNADFDEEISFAALEDHLRRKNLPSLKVRYRNQSTDERRNGMDKKKINWGLKSEELRQRYNYYTSLGYDDKTATVLSLYTYGGRAVPKFSIKDAYEAFVNGEEYPPRPKPVWDRDTMYFYALEKDGGDTATLNFESSPTITAGAVQSFEEDTSSYRPANSSQNNTSKKSGGYIFGAIALIAIVIIAIIGINSANISKQARAIDEEIASIEVVGLKSKEAVVAIRQEYDGLDQKVKEKVQNLSKLEDAETAVAVIEAENAIGLIGDVNLDAGERIEAARAAYDALPADSQAKVSFRSDLFEAEETYHQLVSEANAAHVSELIAGIGKVSAEKIEEVEAASAAYAALSAEEKELVENVETLQKAEEKLEKLIIDEEYKTAHALVEKKKYNEAISSIEKFFDKKGSYPDKLLKELAHAYVLVSKDYEKHKHYEKAEQTLNSACLKYSKYDAFKEASDAKKSLDKKIREMVPANGKVFDSSAKGGHCELTIENGSSPIFIKFENVYDKSKCVSMYVAANQKAKVNVKDGTYRLKYATGSKWYGEVDRFGASTVCYQGDTTDTLKTETKGNTIYYDTLTITIYTVYNGNYSTTEIPASQF